ncbi:PapC N-terminal domain-containing protein, partial [Cupriavidus sp. YR651]|uniref:FimD/PapC N-terminal domain-containing protein n=1 Tax=Cupriavidus sp. YR651 TaxID=1855315 RepID=UPI00088F1A01
MNPKAVQPFAFQLRPISAAVVLAMFLSAGAWANTPTPSDTKLVAEVEFNDQFLQQTGAHIDVSRFSKKNATLAGSYRVDLYVNEVILGRTEVTLRQVGADPLNVQPCFDRDLLERVGVDLTKLSPEATALL